MNKRFTIICASNNETILNKNLKYSKDLLRHEVIVMRGYTNICKAYNEAMKHASHDVIIFVHQDVYLPDNFFKQLELSLLTIEDQDWGVLGVAGVTGKKDCDYAGYLLDRGNIWGSPEKLPKEVCSLDELLLIVKAGSVIFDEGITNNHFFGTDICFQMKDKQKKNYAILAFCHHNSTTNELPANFKETEAYICKKWSKYLPIHTTCTIIKKPKP